MGDDEEIVCRVCHGEAEPDNPLYHPCKCRGSIKWVHQACLVEWLQVSQRNSDRSSCELCGFKFVFTPLYAEDTPKHLSILELMQGVYRNVMDMVVPGIRGAVLLSFWLIVLPMTTVHISRLFWVEPLWLPSLTPSSEDATEEASSLQASLLNILLNPWANFHDFTDTVLEHTSPDGLLHPPEASLVDSKLLVLLEVAADCLSGTLLCLVILLTSFTLLTLREAVLQVLIGAQEEIHDHPPEQERNLRIGGMLDNNNNPQVFHNNPQAVLAAQRDGDDDDAEDEPRAPVVQQQKQQLADVGPGPLVMDPPAHDAIPRGGGGTGAASAADGAHNGTRGFESGASEAEVDLHLNNFNQMREADLHCDLFSIRDGHDESVATTREGQSADQSVNSSNYGRDEGLLGAEDPRDDKLVDAAETDEQMTPTPVYYSDSDEDNLSSTKRHKPSSNEDNRRADSPFTLGTLAAPDPTVAPPAVPAPIVDPLAVPAPIVAPPAAPAPIVDPPPVPAPIVPPLAIPDPIVPPQAEPDPIVAPQAVLDPIVVPPVIRGGDGGMMMGAMGGDGFILDDALVPLNINEALALDQPMDVAILRVFRLGIFNCAFLAIFQLVPFHVGSLFLFFAAPPRGQLVPAWALTNRAFAMSCITAGYASMAMVMLLTLVLLKGVNYLTHLHQTQHTHAQPRHIFRDQPRQDHGAPDARQNTDQPMDGGEGGVDFGRLALDLKVAATAMITSAISWTKVTVLLVLELALLPQGLGWCMDVATLEVLGSSLEKRLAFFDSAPFQALSLHWLAGMGFMVLTTMAASEVRRLLHPDVLPDLLPPHDNDDGGQPLNEENEEHLFDVLAGRRFAQHMIKTLATLGVYLPLMLAAVYGPFKAGHELIAIVAGPFMSTEIKPLRLGFTETTPQASQIQLPMELLLFHVVFPLIANRVSLRESLRGALDWWLKAACRTLGLERWLLNDVPDLQPPPPHAQAHVQAHLHQPPPPLAPPLPPVERLQVGGAADAPVEGHPMPRPILAVNPHTDDARPVSPPPPPPPEEAAQPTMSLSKPGDETRTESEGESWGKGYVLGANADTAAPARFYMGPKDTPGESVERVLARHNELRRRAREARDQFLRDLGHEACVDEDPRLAPLEAMNASPHLMSRQHGTLLLGQRYEGGVEDGARRHHGTVGQEEDGLLCDAMKCGAAEDDMSQRIRREGMGGVPVEEEALAAQVIAAAAAAVNNDDDGDGHPEEGDEGGGRGGGGGAGGVAQQRALEDDEEDAGRQDNHQLGGEGHDHEAQGLGRVRLAPPCLFGRVALLVSSGMVTVFLTVTALVYAPLYTGRYLLNSLLFTGAHDLYNLCVGMLVVSYFSSAVIAAEAQVRGWGLSPELAKAALRWVGAFIKCTILVVLMGVLAPLMLGSFFEALLVIPLRVAIDEVPVMVYSQNWACGLVFLKLWLRLMVLPVHFDPLIMNDHEADAPPEAMEWYRRMQQVREHGIMGVDFTWTMQHVVMPTLLTLTDAALIPYVMSQGIAPLFLESHMDRAWAARLALPVYLMFKSLLLMVRAMRRALIALHDKIRDDRYLLGVQLHNKAQEPEAVSSAIDTNDPAIASSISDSSSPEAVPEPQTT